MINKKSLWFVTLFSLILVLSAYYITMPSELLVTNNGEYLYDSSSIDIKQGNILTALKVEEDDKVNKEIESLRLVLNDDKTSSEEKNNAFEKLKNINLIRGEEEKLVNKIKSNLNLDSYVGIEDDKIKVVILSNEHSNNLANNVIRTIQEEYSNEKYITVKFQS